MSTEIEQVMLQSWLPVAEKHASESGGDICALDINAEQYPEQGLDVFHFSGDPQPPQVITGTTMLVDDRFEAICKELYNDPTSASAFDRAGEILDDGNSVIVATNHTELIDVAVVQAATYNYLKGQEREFSNGLVISKMVSLIGSTKLQQKEEDMPIPATAVLKILCDDVYMSYPKTATTRKTELARSMPEVIRASNRKVSTAIAQKLGEGSMLLAMCPSGTTDKLEKTGDTCTLQPVQAGTARLMSREDTYILPIAANFGDNPFIRASDIPRQLSSPAEAHTVMQSIARTLQENLPQVEFQYSQQ